MIRYIAIALLLISGALSSAAFASGDVECTGGPRESWQSEDQIGEAARALGYEVRRVKKDDSCYEVYAVSSEGENVELYFDPVTGELVGQDD